MTLNISYTPSSSVTNERKLYAYNGTNDSYLKIGTISYDDAEPILRFSILSAVGCTGLLGNGSVIWFLFLRIQRNSLIIYILHLALANFMHLVTIIIGNLLYLSFRIELQLILRALLWFMYFTEEFLLLSISIDRCVYMFIPIWHQHHQPKYFSTIVCIILWVLSFLLTMMPLILEKYYAFEFSVDIGHLFILIDILCLLLIIVSTTALLIKICLKSQQRKWGKLLKVILLNIFCFLIFTFPLSILFSTEFLLDIIIISSQFYPEVCTSLKCSINPVIYFLVGRRKEGPTDESVKVILERVFKEEGDARQESVAPASRFP